MIVHFFELTGRAHTFFFIEDAGAIFRQKIF